MQLCVFKLFSFYFDWGLIGATDQVASFAGDGLMVVLSNAIGVLLFMLPFFVLLIFNHIIVIEKESIKVNITKVILSVLVYFIFIFNFINKPFFFRYSSTYTNDFWIIENCNSY